ncbi:CRISPR-associated endonuclease Cas2 [Larkinella sp. VNQ87]|uniref:CRISPR-associated endonuclease Cas2 n=1 Tax=Larkinella sp. VNQ87 TaxID=3400921 RepID=UPI003C02526D
MLYLACYDLENTKVRTKVAQMLLAHGLERIQESVFVGTMDDGLWTRLMLEIERILQPEDPATNRFLLMPLANAYARKTVWLGNDPPDWPYHCHEVNTLIL